MQNLSTILRFHVSGIHTSCSLELSERLSDPFVGLEFLKPVKSQWIVSLVVGML